MGCLGKSNASKLTLNDVFSAQATLRLFGGNGVPKHNLIILWPTPTLFLVPQQKSFCTENFLRLFIATAFC